MQTFLLANSTLESQDNSISALTKKEFERKKKKIQTNRNNRISTLLELNEQKLINNKELKNKKIKKKE